MPIQQITPSQFFKIRKEKILFSISICFLLVSLASLIVFLANIKSDTTKSGQKIYRENSKIPLYVSVPFSLLSLCLFSFIILAYNKIFSLEKSPILIIVFVLTGLSLIILILDIIYMVRKFNVCPDGKEYNKDADQCVPICPDGYYIGTNLLCARGCQTKNDCPDNHECIDGNCCDLDKNQIVDGNCCPNNYVHTKGDGSLYCCPQPLCQANGKEICCDGNNLVCEESDKGDPYCAVKCGTEDDSPVCGEGQYCLIYPASLNDPSKTGKIYKCAGGPGTCSAQGDPKYYPQSIDNFYPAYNKLIGDEPDLNSFLDNTPDTDNYNAVINEYNNAEQNQNKGYISGLENAIQFQTNTYNGKCDIEVCMSNVQYPYTKEIELVEGDNDTFYCNQYKTFEKEISSANNDDDDSYYTTQITENKDNIVTLVSNDKAFSKTPPVETPKPGNALNDTGCAHQNFYSEDSSTFEDCGSDGCPFPNTSQEYVCPETNDVRYIQNTGYDKKNACVVQDGAFVCKEVDKDDYKYSLYCDDPATCTKNLLDNYQITSDCVTGEDQFYSSGQPYQGAGQFCYGESYPGTGLGKCDFEVEIVNKKPTIQTTDYDFPCPLGTSPYFWANKFDSDGYGGCYHHNGYFTRADYVCCDDVKFRLTDAENAEDYVSDKPPTNINYCFGPDQSKQPGSSNKYSLESTDSGHSKSILIGRGGTDNPPTAGNNTCNNQAEKGLDLVQRVLGKTNQNLFKT